MSKITKDTIIGILYGGWSDEREISLESGSSVYDSLKDAGYKVFLFDLKNNKEELSKFISKYSIEIIFNLIHGTGGEDGTIQSWLDDLQIKYVGSNSKSSRLSFSKTKTKEIWIRSKLKTPDFISHVDLESWILAAISMNNKSKPSDDNSSFKQETIKKINNFLESYDRYVLKPDCSGSSVGIKIFNNPNELSYHCESLSKDYLENTISQNFLEKYISGSEYTAPIIGNTVFPIIKIETKREFYDYQAKYVDDDTSFTFPSFDSNLQRIINSKCLKAFKSLGCKGWGRVDFFIDDDNGIYLIEVNTIPGMTSHSLVPMSAKQKNLSYLDLILLILNTG